MADNARKSKKIQSDSLVSSDALAARAAAWIEESAIWAIEHKQISAAEAEKMRRLLKGDADAVNHAFLQTGAAEKNAARGKIHLSAERVENIQKTAKTSAGGRRARIARDGYLYWLLLRLKKSEAVDYTLPLQANERPPRQSAFDAAAPELPPHSVFLRWQKAIAFRVLDAKKLSGYVIEDERKKEMEFRAIGAMLAFGGIGGRDALQKLSLLTEDDYKGARSCLWLRNRRGNKFFNLSLHPVQALALNAYCREKTGVENNPGLLFPVLGTQAGRNRFHRWLKQILSSAPPEEGSVASGETDEFRLASSSPSAAPNLQSLLAGVQRWMLEIYPVYLVAILAGKFDSPVKDETASAEVKKTAEYFPSKTERVLRARLRVLIKDYLEIKSGNFKSQNCESLYGQWNLRLEESNYIPFVEGGLRRTNVDECVEGRRWNLFLLVKSLESRLKKGATKRYTTISRWFDTGCSLLDALDGHPIWEIDAQGFETVKNKANRFAALEFAVHHTEMNKIAAEYGFKKSLLAQNYGYRISSLSQTIRASKQPPTESEIGRLIIFLQNKIEQKRKICGVAAEVVLHYLDLLIHGLRKEEAANLTAADVDEYFEREDAAGADQGTEANIAADLIVSKGKTPAARRAIPLGQSLMEESARRIIGAARKLKIEGREKTPLLTAITGKNVRRHKRSFDKDDYALAKIDRALADACERARLERFTPHQFRHASISIMLESGKTPTEIVAKVHGHTDLTTTFEFYAHSLAAIQKADLDEFLAQPENDVWVSLPDACRLIGVSKQYVYKRYRKNKNSDSSAAAVAEPEENLPSCYFVVRRKGKPQYARASRLVEDLKRHIEQAAKE
jgi:integrase